MNSYNILVLLNCPRIGRKSVNKMVDLCKGQAKNIETSYDYIDIIHEFNSLIVNTIDHSTIDIAKKKAESIISHSEKQNIKIIGFTEHNYPIKLKNLGIDAPVILYVKGDLDALHYPKKVAIIGTRNNSEHGFRIGSQITKQFVDRGYYIVSGLAKGCDTIAHKSCLDSGGKTIAVLAGGIDSIYPKENRKLADNIIENGCLISEYPIGTKSLANFFVERNRIQSGLSSGVVVIETDIKSGTMHTVNFGKKLGREIACVNYKDNILLQSNAGNRKLINEGDCFALTTENIDLYLSRLKV